MAVHHAILAQDIGGDADGINGAVVFMDEGVEFLATRGSHPPYLHHPVAVQVGATCRWKVHVLPQESFIHGLAIGGLHQPQPQQGQQ